MRAALIGLVLLGGCAGQVQQIALEQTLKHSREQCDRMEAKAIHGATEDPGQTVATIRAGCDFAFELIKEAYRAAMAD